MDVTNVRLMHHDSCRCKFKDFYAILCCKRKVKGAMRFIILQQALKLFLIFGGIQKVCLDQIHFHIHFTRKNCKV